MLVQIYGLTTVSDAVAVDRLGPDFIGIVLDEGIDTWDKVDEATAREIASAIHSAQVVGLSLSTDIDRIAQTVEIVRPAVLHLARGHLMSTADLAELRRSIASTVMATVPVNGPNALQVARSLCSVADYVLLDTTHPSSGVVGATGVVHDWGVSADVVAAIELPVFLAGGLGPHNVAEAIRRVQPAGVDSETRTSLESDRRRKDLEKVEAFIEIAKTTGRELR